MSVTVFPFCLEYLQVNYPLCHCLMPDIEFIVLKYNIFVYKMEKARLFLSLIFVAMFGLIWAGVMLARSLEIEITEGMVIGAIAAGVLLTAACFFLSYRVSLRIVKRKEW